MIFKVCRKLVISFIWLCLNVGSVSSLNTAKRKKNLVVNQKEVSHITKEGAKGRVKSIHSKLKLEKIMQL